MSEDVQSPREIAVRATMRAACNVTAMRFIANVQRIADVIQTSSRHRTILARRVCS